MHWLRMPFTPGSSYRDAGRLAATQRCPKAGVKEKVRKFRVSRDHMAIEYICILCIYIYIYRYGSKYLLRKYDWGYDLEG